MKHKNKLTGITAVICIMCMVVGCVLCACKSGGDPGYTQISQEEAMEMMESESGYLIVDVRRPDEFAEEHITGAINVPNEAIQTNEADSDEILGKLPDKDQLLLIYCRTGNRSKEASQKLAEFGYTNVYEFGGITTWEGPTVTEDSAD